MAEQIPLYNAPIVKPQVPVQGMEILNRAANRVGAAGEEEARLANQAGHALNAGLHEVGAGFGEVGKAIETHDTNADLIGLHTAGAAMLNGLTAQFSDYMAKNGNNPNANQDFFSQYVQPAIDKLQDGAQTDKGRLQAAELGANMANHFTEMGGHFQAEAAARAAGQGIQSTNTNLIQAVTQNPGNLPMALRNTQLLHDNLAEANPNASDAAIKASLGQARQNLILAAGDSYIQKTVAAGQTPDVEKFFGKYGAELSPEARSTLLQHQQQQISLGLAQGQVNAQQATTARQTATNDAAAQTIFSAFDTQNNRVAIPTNFFQKLGEVITSEGSTSETKQLVRDAAQWARSNPQLPTTNPAVESQLIGSLAGANRPTTNELMRHVMAGDLSFQDAQWMNNALKGPPSPALVQLNHNLTEARSQLMSNAGSGTFNPAAQAAFNRFQAYAVTRFVHGESIEPNQLEGILETFKPTGQDAMAHVPTLTGEKRKPLKEIFGG